MTLGNHTLEKARPYSKTWPLRQETINCTSGQIRSMSCWKFKKKTWSFLRVLLLCKTQNVRSGSAIVRSAVSPEACAKRATCVANVFPGTNFDLYNSAVIVSGQMSFPIALLCANQTLNAFSTSWRRRNHLSIGLSPLSPPWEQLSALHLRHDLQLVQFHCHRVRTNVLLQSIVVCQPSPNRVVYIVRTP